MTPHSKCSRETLVVTGQVTSFNGDLTTTSERKKVISMLEFRLCTSLPSLKKWREFRRSCKQKKLPSFFAFVIFEVSSNILGHKWKAGALFSRGFNFYSDKFNLQNVCEPLICPRSTRRTFRSEDTFFPQTHFTYYIRIN